MPQGGDGGPYRAIEAVRDGGEIDDQVMLHGIDDQVSKEMGSQAITMPEAMAKFPYIFPEIMIETLRAGDAGGGVAESMAQVADDLEAADNQRAQVKKALTYPVIVMAISSAIFIFMIMYVVPKFGTPCTPA